MVERLRVIPEALTAMIANPPQAGPTKKVAKATPISKAPIRNRKIQSYPAFLTSCGCILKGLSISTTVRSVC